MTETDPSLAPYFREIRRVPLLGEQEERELFRRLSLGDGHAREKIASANQRLVVKIAKHYGGRGLPLGDLIGEGNVGLMQAIDNFRLSKECRLSTYAAYWIRRAIGRALHHDISTVRPPVNVSEAVPKYRRSVASLERKLGRSATRAEISVGLHLPQAKVDQYEKACCAQEGATPLSSFTSLDDVLGASSASRYDWRAWLREIDYRDQLLALMQAVTDREREVLSLRYGLDGGVPMTLEEIGKRQHVTRSMIGQIEQRALRKMRGARRRRRPTHTEQMEDPRGSSFRSGAWSDAPQKQAEQQVDRHEPPDEHRPPFPLRGLA